MKRKIRWGVLSTARIATQKVIPAMQNGQLTEVRAIASRDFDRAVQVGKQLGIPKVHGSYEELLQDPDIDAIYNPLPNHMHIPWTIKALDAGKHVLCEKPLGLSSNEISVLMEATKKYPYLKVMEAFMYRLHPQWQKVKEMTKEGAIGNLVTINSFFSYYNVDPNNIRNRAEVGGGGMMDIGCYCISLARFLFEREPVKVIGLVEYDPVLQTDRLASGLLDFSTGTSTFTCSTQLMAYQRVNILGTSGRIEIEIPFNAPSDAPCKVWHFTAQGVNEIRFEICDQYTIQGDLFSQSIIEDTPVPTPLHDAFHNMKAIEALLQSASSLTWQTCT